MQGAWIRSSKVSVGGKVTSPKTLAPDRTVSGQNLSFVDQPFKQKYWAEPSPVERGKEIPDWTVTRSKAYLTGPLPG